MRTYYQCRLRHLGDDGVQEQTAWIESKGAKVGAQVELLPSKVLWWVCEVYKHGLPETVLKERELNNRKGLPSLRDSKKDRRQRETA